MSRIDMRKHARIEDAASYIMMCNKNDNDPQWTRLKLQKMLYILDLEWFILNKEVAFPYSFLASDRIGPYNEAVLSIYDYFTPKMYAENKTLYIDKVYHELSTRDLIPLSDEMKQHIDSIRERLNGVSHVTLVEPIMREGGANDIAMQRYLETEKNRDRIITPDDLQKDAVDLGYYPFEEYLQRKPSVYDSAVDRFRDSLKDVVQNR